MPDRRWPHMQRIDGTRLLPLEPEESRAVTAWARRIEGRTGRYAFFNRRHNLVHFCLRSDDCSVAPPATKVRTNHRISLPAEDDIVRQLNLCKVPPWLKDREMASRERAAKHDEAESIHNLIEDAKPDMRDQARHLTGERMLATVP